MNLTRNYSFIWVSILTIFLFQCQSKKKTPAIISYDFPIDSSIVILQSFSDEISESSGIIEFGGKIWTHNDSGGDPVLYQFDVESGKITKEVTIKNVSAKDWEDIAQDSAFVYVGDFGNNGGKRQDLAIYKINKSQLLQNKEVKAETIEFFYSDRIDFNPAAYKHDFDCEAMIATKDSLYLFSKNHQNLKTRLYGLPNHAGKHQAVLLDSFDTKGMVTGADLDEKKGVLSFIGYRYLADGGFEPFVWVFKDFPKNRFFAGTSKRVNLSFFIQAEGICFSEKYGCLISTEKSHGMKGKILKANIGHGNTDDTD